MLDDPAAWGASAIDPAWYNRKRAFVFGRIDQADPNRYRLVSELAYVFVWFGEQVVDHEGTRWPSALALCAALHAQHPGYSDDETAIMTAFQGAPLGWRR